MIYTISVSNPAAVVASCSFDFQDGTDLRVRVVSCLLFCYLARLSSFICHLRALGASSRAFNTSSKRLTAPCVPVARIISRTARLQQGPLVARPSTPITVLLTPRPHVLFVTSSRTDSNVCQIKYPPHVVRCKYTRTRFVPFDTIWQASIYALVNVYVAWDADMA